MLTFKIVSIGLDERNELHEFVMADHVRATAKNYNNAKALCSMLDFYCGIGAKGDRVHKVISNYVLNPALN